MPEVKTVSVVSKDPVYHNGEPFTINEEDFDPEKHKLAGKDAEENNGNPDNLDKFTVAELREIAAQRGIELKGNLTKAAIIELIEPKQ